MKEWWNMNARVIISSINAILAITFSLKSEKRKIKGHTCCHGQPLKSTLGSFDSLYFIFNGTNEHLFASYLFVYEFLQF
jgi:hypothetical protein